MWNIAAEVRPLSPTAWTSSSEPTWSVLESRPLAGTRLSAAVYQRSFAWPLRLSQQASAAVNPHPASAAGHSGRTKRAAGSEFSTAPSRITWSARWILPQQETWAQFPSSKVSQSKAKPSPPPTKKSFMNGINKILPSGTCQHLSVTRQWQTPAPISASYPQILSTGLGSGNLCEICYISHSPKFSLNLNF